MSSPYLRVLLGTLVFFAVSLCAANARAANLGLLGVDSSARAVPTAPVVPSVSLLRDAWKWQEDANAVLYATADVTGLCDTVGASLAADLLRSVLKVEQAEEVTSVSRLTSRSVFTSLKAPETFVLVDTTIPAARLAEHIGARVGAVPEAFEDGGRTYFTLPMSPTHTMTAVALGQSRVQIAFHPTDGEVSLLAAETPMNGVQARALDPSALLSVHVTNPRAIPDVSTGGLSAAVRDGVRNGIKNALVGNLATLDAAVRRLPGDQMRLEMRLIPVAGVTPDDLLRRYDALKRTAGMAGGEAMALINRLVFTARGGYVAVEMTAPVAEFQPYLLRLARGEMPWS